MSGKKDTFDSSGQTQSKKRFSAAHWRTTVTWSFGKATFGQFNPTRTFDQLKFWTPDPDQQPRTLLIQNILGENRQLVQLKSDGEFLYLLSDEAFLVVDLESSDVLFSQNVAERGIVDFYVSPGNDFYALLVSKNSMRNLMVVVEAEEESILLSRGGKDELGKLTRKFYLEQKASLGKYSIFEGTETRKTEENLSRQEIIFKTSEKQIREIFFDDKIGGLFYVQYCDHTFEGYVICRDFDQTTRIDRINEVNLHNNQQENVLLKVESNLEILDVSDGQLTLYDRRNDENVQPKTSPTLNSLAVEVRFAPANNSDTVFSVPGPGFENLNQTDSDAPSE